MQKSHGFVGSMALACLLVSAGCNSRADEEPAAPATTTTEAPAAGEKAFAVCTTCHSVEAGVNKTGPSLHGVVGREAGTVADFNYTDANKNSGITWTPEELFVYLADPQATIPGT